ncbi:MAG TPA: MFS transporter [Candidatus Binatia bacterium]|nr:MFS transporter [Candidatus Binatia bacterium]
MNPQRKNVLGSATLITAAKSQNLWTPAFVLLCCAQFFGSAQHALLQPTFPLYITSLGGTAFEVGLVLACFAATSVVFRPLIGGWADSWSETGVLMCGLLLLSAAVIFCFIPYVEATMFANALRGLGWAGLSAAGYSLLALSAPPARRGEASGFYSGVQASGTILLPAVALWLIDAPFGGFHTVFIVAIALAALGAGTGAIRTRYASEPAHKPHAAPSAPWWKEVLSVLDREIILASVLSFSSHVTFPAVTSFLVLYAREIGIDNIGWFYVATGTTSLLARPVLGKVSDQIGRRRALLACFILQALALLALSFASSLLELVIPGTLYMLGLAMASATTLAIAMEQAKPERRGRAMATFSIALPLSNGVGALLCGSLVQGFGFFWMYVAVAAIAAAGLLITIAQRAHLK